jgi:hypothetical protein
MNMRIAKKVLGNKPLDPNRKPSEQTPYNDAQIVEAHRRFRMSLKRHKRAGGDWMRPKWLCRDPRQPRMAWEAGRFLLHPAPRAPSAGARTP